MDTACSLLLAPNTTTPGQSRRQRDDHKSRSTRSPRGWRRMSLRYTKTPTLTTKSTRWSGPLRPTWRSISSGRENPTNPAFSDIEAGKRMGVAAARALGSQAFLDLSTSATGRGPAACPQPARRLPPPGHRRPSAALSGGRVVISASKRRNLVELEIVTLAARPAEHPRKRQVELRSRGSANAAKLPRRESPVSPKCRRLVFAIC